MDAVRLFTPRCQLEDAPYRYRWPLGALRALRRALRRVTAPRGGPRLGRASAYPIGSWVRVKSGDALRRALDPNDRTRGLHFIASQRWTSGKTFRVDGMVRRILDDAGRLRAVSRTVTLRGVLCDGPHGQDGCGRACPMFFRDEWLEPAERDFTAQPEPARWARVRLLHEIWETLDRGGRCDGMRFMPEMERFSGRRLPVYRQVTLARPRWWRQPAGEWYVLAGARCRGTPFAREGGCDRGCSVLWHRSWLDFERPT